jgi:hypothetical protein
VTDDVERDVRIEINRNGGGSVTVDGAEAAGS